MKKEEQELEFFLFVSFVVNALLSFNVGTGRNGDGKARALTTKDTKNTKQEQIRQRADKALPSLRVLRVLRDSIF